MKILTLSELIAETIEAIRYKYIFRNEYDLQEFYSFMKLSSGVITDIPISDNEEFRELSEENIVYYRTSFENGEEIIQSAQEIIYGQKIEDIIFCYYKDKTDDDHSAFLKLSNGYYLTEKNIAPTGVTGIDLLYFNQQQFENQIISFNLNVKSYINEVRENK